MKTNLLLAFFLLFPLQLFAYFVAIPAEQQTLDHSKSVRILVSGRGTDLSTLPQLSALTIAEMYKRNFPHDQLVLISVFENEKNEDLLLRAGWKFLTKNQTSLFTQSILKELVRFEKIQSLEFFGHNSPSLGTQTDGKGFRFDFREPQINQLAKKFTANAFVSIHGCNSGWIIAQDLARRWPVAVSGSFTGTRFERLHSDGHFYVYDINKAPNNNWASVHAGLDQARCSFGGCLRMRPAYSTYIGKWGNFNGPLLSHYKFFCQLPEQDCQRRMALALHGFVTEEPLHSRSTFEEFKKTAREYLCPVYKDRSITEACFKYLESVEAGATRTKHFVVGNEQLTCTLKSCRAKMTCDDHKCSVTDRISSGSTTLADEYLHFLKGYLILRPELQKMNPHLIRM